MCCVEFAPPAGTVKLQGIPGHQPGTPAGELKPGDVILWNFGYKSEVVSITHSKSGKTAVFMLRSAESGKVTPRKMNTSRLIVKEDKTQ